MKLQFHDRGWISKSNFNMIEFKLKIEAPVWNRISILKLKFNFVFHFLFEVVLLANYQLG